MTAPSTPSGGGDRSAKDVALDFGWWLRINHLLDPGVRLPNVLVQLYFADTHWHEGSVIPDWHNASAGSTADAEEPTATAGLNPLPANDVERYATALRQLLDALGGEIVTSALSALVGECETAATGQLHMAIGPRSEPSDLRGLALAVLDAFTLLNFAVAHLTADDTPAGDQRPPTRPAPWTPRRATRDRRIDPLLIDPLLLDADRR